MLYERVIGLIASVIFFIVVTTPLWFLIIGFIGCYIEEIQEQKKFNDEIKKQEVERKYWDWLLSPEQIEKRRLEKTIKTQEKTIKTQEKIIKELKYKIKEDAIAFDLIKKSQPEESELH